MVVHLNSNPKTKCSTALDFSPGRVRDSPIDSTSIRCGPIEVIQSESTDLLSERPVRRPYMKIRQYTPSRAESLIIKLVWIFAIFYGVLFSVLTMMAFLELRKSLFAMTESEFRPDPFVVSSNVMQAATGFVCTVFSVVLLRGLIKKKSNCVLAYFTFGMLKTFIAFVIMLMIYLQGDYVPFTNKMAILLWTVFYGIFVEMLLMVHCYFVNREIAEFATKLVQTERAFVIKQTQETYNDYL